jgi:hypothetical protein
MKFKDLSLKAKFDAAIISVFGAPARVSSDALASEGYVARLNFTDTQKNGQYEGVVQIFEKDGAPFLWGAGQLYKSMSASPHGEGVKLEDVPRRIEQWQETMIAQGWTNKGAPDIAGGAEYRAVAYKNDITL